MKFREVVSSGIDVKNWWESMMPPFQDSLTYAMSFYELYKDEEMRFGTDLLNYNTLVYPTLINLYDTFKRREKIINFTYTGEDAETHKTTTSGTSNITSNDRVDEGFKGFTAANQTGKFNTTTSSGTNATTNSNTISYNINRTYASLDEKRKALFNENDRLIRNYFKELADKMFVEVW